MQPRKEDRKRNIQSITISTLRFENLTTALLREGIVKDKGCKFDIYYLQSTKLSLSNRFLALTGQKVHTNLAGLVIKLTNFALKK